jgi:hypothetical protein
VRPGADAPESIDFGAREKGAHDMGCVRCALRAVPGGERAEAGARALAQTGLVVSDLPDQECADIAVDKGKLCPACVAMFVMWFGFPEADGAVQTTVMMHSISAEQLGAMARQPGSGVSVLQRGRRKRKP